MMTQASAATTDIKQPVPRLLFDEKTGQSLAVFELSAMVGARTARHYTRVELVTDGGQGEHSDFLFDTDGHTWGDRHLLALYRVYQAGHAAGHIEGQKAVQEQIRRALGI